MYNSEMRTKKIKKLNCKLDKTPYDLPDPETEMKIKERTKPSVERRNTPAERKYNEFVESLYKKKRKY